NRGDFGSDRIPRVSAPRGSLAALASASGRQNRAQRTPTSSSIHVNGERAPGTQLASPTRIGSRRALPRVASCDGQRVAVVTLAPRSSWASCRALGARAGGYGRAAFPGVGVAVHVAAPQEQIVGVADHRATVVEAMTASGELFQHGGRGRSCAFVGNGVGNEAV